MQAGHLRAWSRLQASLEVFVADDALEGEAFDERHLFDAFELIGEGNTFEGVIIMKCVFADSFEAFVEDDALEGGAFNKRHRFDVSGRVILVRA